MRELIQKPHIILSVENPVDSSKVKRAVPHEVAIKALSRVGDGTVTELKGHYNKPERSILISDPSENQMALARKLASETGQESHIESDGMSHKMIYSQEPNVGKVVHGQGTVFHETPPENYFSTLSDGTHFTHNFDFEKSEKPFHGYNKEKHSRTGGLSDKYRKKYNRETGSNLKRPVTGKVKAGSKAAKRRKSFCARMKGVSGPTSKDGKLTPKGAALKRWKCSKSEEHIPGGIASKEDIKRLPKDLLDQGVKVEMEHTSDPNIAREIAADHLMEDRNYYSKLSELEKSKNVREQRKKVFGTDPNAPRTSERRMKMMQRIRDYAERKYGLPLVTATGKRGESGEVKDKGYQKPFDVFSPEGIEQEKAYLQQLKERGEKRTDPKPDWRSGRLETQPSPDAAIHELAHLDLAPESTTAPDFQSEMDRLWGESQSKYGHMQQKRTQGEIQPMSVENPIRRELGLPANRATKPVKEQEYALDAPSQPRFVEGKDPQGRKAFYDRQSRLQSPETRERLQQIREGSLKFHPDTGWYRATDPNALINLRARGQKQEAEERAKTKLAEQNEPKKMAASEEPLMKPYHSEAQRRWAHTPAGTKALGGKKAVKEWDEATRGKKLPEKVEKRCWEGYEPTPGKKPYSKGSCRPIKKEENSEACDCDMDKGEIGPNCKAKLNKYKASSMKKDIKGIPTSGLIGLSRTEEVKKAWEASINKEPGKEALNFGHPEHGTVSIVKQGNMLHVKHNEAPAELAGNKGVFSNLKDAAQHASQYRNFLETKPSASPSPGSAWTHKGFDFSETTHPKTPKGYKAYSLSNKKMGTKDVLFARSPEEAKQHIDKVTWKPKWFQEESSTKKNVGVAPGKDPMSPFNKKD